ncbi:hypothetical protein Bca4012_030135 [Brassica carinata]|uniref:Protein kinase domain-containing protein n=1 Tax=Brassica carinata TaxID=52824 RepID=A0A8X7US92_BRACI|nr:hypothetical protein Bca52824_048503 [Brassica carinata]
MDVYGSPSLLGHDLEPNFGCKLNVIFLCRQGKKTEELHVNKNGDSDAEDRVKKCVSKLDNVLLMTLIPHILYPYNDNIFLKITKTLFALKFCDSPGFISLDCGLSPSESPYTDPVTGLIFLSDADFIQSGKRGEVGDDESYTYKQFKDLRYFPDGVRNCYNLTVNKGISYLIRAGFSYGNYDGLNISPRFHMHIGPNMWTSVVVGSESYREIIYMSKYPDDVLDRIWDRYKWFETDVKTTLNVTSFNPFAVPDAVSRSGITPRNSSSPLFFYAHYKKQEKSGKINVYFHFADIQVLKANDTREFDILLDGTVIRKAYTPKVLQSETIYNISPQKCINSCDLDLVQTQRSTLPPLINAIETFDVLEFPYAETNQNDVTAMKNIEAIYGLNMISWQGDPCVPEVLKWEGLKCSYTNNAKTDFLYFTNPRDLSNNSLTGGVPEFLANMKSLSIIFVHFISCSTTFMVLRINGNPKLCADASCKKNNQKYVLPVITSTASVLVIIAVLILILVFKKKKSTQVQHELPNGRSINRQTKRFTYSEVVAFTDNFERVLGEGGFGIVHHGSLNGTQPIAVKLLSQSSVQGYKEFKAEVELLLRVHHVNLVSLVGYCDEEGHLALIYEYAPNGDLKQHLSAWVGYMLTKGDIENVVDPRLNREYEPTSVWKALEIAISCVNPSSEKRPNMSQVINELKECLTLENSRQGGRPEHELYH